jgi:hypothetical protein
MKKIVILISLVILLKPVFPVVEYAVHYDYIAKVLCINKSHPELGCNGKCHLKKALAANTETERPASSEKKNHINDLEISFFEPVACFEFPQPLAARFPPINARYTNTALSTYHHALLRPPISL